MTKVYRRRRRIIMGLGATLLLFLVAGGLAVGARALSPLPTNTQQQTVAPAGAVAATVTIDMPGGMMDVRSGSGSLLDADFSYSQPLDEPMVQYERQGAQGKLLVQQPPQAQEGWRRLVNRWQLRLGRELPLSLAVTAGDGVHSLDLRGLPLRQAQIAFEAGVMSVNLGGYWPENVDVTLQGGEGLLVVTVPQGMGARVSLSGEESEVKAEGLRPAGDGVYLNEAYDSAANIVDVRVEEHPGEITLRTSRLPGDLPVKEALKLAKLIYSKEGTFSCSARPDDGHHLSTDMVKDLWYDYLCERGPEHRYFDGDDPLTRELAEAELIDRIRREYYRMETDIVRAPLKFNGEEFLSATLDMLLKAQKGPEHAEFSLTHFMGSFTYSVERVGDRLYYTVENQTDLASGTHLPLRFPDAGYTQSLEALVAREPELADAFLLELVQSNRYPLISILEAKSRQETSDELAEGGGTQRQTFTWSEPYLAESEQLPPWPEYVRDLEIR